jgi:hypothetical protein
MNIAQIETPLFAFEAKTCGNKYNKKVISYHFIESNHGLCMDKRDTNGPDTCMRTAVKAYSKR